MCTRRGLARRRAAHRPRRRGGELAVAHLLALGHRRIALVNGPLAIRQCADRRRGACEAVRKSGLDPAEVLVEVPVEVPVPGMSTRCGRPAAPHPVVAIPSPEDR